MTTKHAKLAKPTNKDLVRNPLIGGSKGVTMAQATAEDLENLKGANTIEGDVDNDTNPQGGIEKPSRTRKRPSHARDHAGKPRRPELQGNKTHEQQLRMLERKPDVPDQRQVRREIAELPARATGKVAKRSPRHSEFPVSRGGMNQESKHNKHHRHGQTGHKPSK